MSTTASSTRSPASATTIAPVAVLTALVALAGTWFGAHDWGEIISMSALVVVAATLVFGVVVPRALRRTPAGGTALGLSIPAVLLALPAFWTGLPLVLGVAGVLVGNAGRRSRTGSGKCIVAIALGALAAVAYLSIYVMEAFAGTAGFLFD